ncbi:MAG: hypothetical protein ACE5OO_01325 [Candidatus Bathyarchaeia archaeon]
MVRTYVKVYGPPVIKAIKALEAVAVEMTKAFDLKFSHKCLPYPRHLQSDVNDWNSYLENMSRVYVDCWEPVRLISEAHQMLGDDDFFFEWSERPDMERLERLIERIDDALQGLGCYYTVTTR